MAETMKSAPDQAGPETTRERYARVRAQLDEICKQAGRDPKSVRLVAVSKTVGIEDVALAREGGACDFGENRPDGLIEKHDAFPHDRWHFIGNIQSRRIRDIVGRAVLIHSLFDVDHARKINEVAARQGIVQDVLLEVNVSGEESKSGCAPEDAPALLAACAAMEHVRVRGLMTMAPRGNQEVARAAFEGLAALHERLKAQLPADKAAVFNELSMGMSEDWREAVFAGATMIRIGRAIFSDQFSER